MKELQIFIDENKTVCTFILENEAMYSRTFKNGIAFFEQHALGVKSASALLSMVISVLEHVSLMERIPSSFVIITKRHGAWIKKVLEDYHYTQFYLPEKRVNAILQEVHTKKDYARHTKTLSFKV